MKDISNTVQRSVSTVQSIIKRCSDRGDVENIPRKGRPEKLSTVEKRQIIRKVKQNPQISASTIVAGLAEASGSNVSTEIVRRVLHKSGYKNRVARQKPFISSVNRKKRQEFSKTYLNHPESFWSTVLFSDETKFNIMNSGGRVRVWRKKNKELDPKNLSGTFKHGGGSVTLWGCMAASGVGSMHFIDGIMDQYLYIDILKENLRNSVEKLQLPDRYVFQQDNDPKHTALNTRLWLLYIVPNQLKTPPQSTDLNPIEHLWADLERQIKKRELRTKNDLKNALKEEWDRISPDRTKKLVLSMTNRLKEVIKQRGYPTRY